MTDHPARRIALIHALEESVLPVRAAFARVWPEARSFDLLDTSLAPDRALAGRCDEAIVERFRRLAAYAADSEGAGGRTAGILFTCSAFGPAIEATRRRVDIPVLKPNEAAFRDGLAIGRRIGLCVTFEPSLSSLTGELEAEALRQGGAASVTPVLVKGALAALKAGDGATHDRLVGEACRALRDIDVLILGQFSLARAAATLRDLPYPVITTPDAAVGALRRLVLNGAD